MTKRMLIDATHAEETRVVVLDGNRLEDFDVEASTKKQLKGNIYLAKIVRVEPSLQAAFVEYGGGRHGFLAFGEIHPDYYQIPVADRQRLLKMQAEEARAEEEEDDEDEAPPAPQPAAKPERGRRRRGGGAAREAALESPVAATAYGEIDFGAVTHGALDGAQPDFAADPAADYVAQGAPEIEGIAEPADEPFAAAAEAPDTGADTGADTDGDSRLDIVETDEAPPEALGGGDDVFEGNGAEEAAARRTARFLRNYRIQEVIRRRQIMLVQVVKEERGTKGAALTTYISLAGRFCVLMPNSPRGGGISRKITSSADRRRLKEITAELEIPQGMGLIVRTAGANRPKPEIKRDCEYLMNQWDSIREITMKSVAPALIYEEASLIKRTIRDGYSRDIDEVLVDGEAAWRAARDFMRMLMPSHAKKVQLWRPEGISGGGGQPLFAKHGVEDQLDSMLVPTVQLKSGGYLVINQAEALVAIDVNSGRSTRERGIEETALRTNLEAADEVARQLRLRDLAGLIVIDFIDMESKKNNAMVERRLKEALKNDRARIQIGQISHFGLLEMSRQRLRPSLTETSFITCPHCAGLGLVRNVESSAIHVMRQIEDEGAKGRAGQIMVHAAQAVAMYILNNKRDRLAEIEARYAMRVHFSADDTLVAPAVRIDRLRPPLSEAERALLVPSSAAIAQPAYDFVDDDEAEEAPDIAEAAVFAPTPAPMPAVATAPMPAAADEDDDDGPGDVPESGPEASGGDEGERRRRRRRRRRGGRREEGEESQAASNDAPATVPGDEPAPWMAAEQPDAAFVPPADVVTEAAPEAGPVADATDEPVAALDPAEQEQPTLDPEELDENGLPKARRRGRRGGRRRRRDDGTDEAAAEAPAPSVAPPAPAPIPAAPVPAAPVAARPIPARPMPPPVPTYTGPTPADPFGGQPFDIFDILERAELAEQAQAAQAPTPPAVPAPPPAPAPVPAPVVAEVAAEVVAEPAPPVAEAPVEAPAPVPATPPAAPPAKAPRAPRTRRAAAAAVVPVVVPAELEIPPVPADAAPPADLAVEPVVEAPVPAESVIVSEPTAAVPPEPASEQAATAPESAPNGAPAVGAAIKPIVLGSDPLPVATPKRGWWKR